MLANESSVARADVIDTLGFDALWRSCGPGRLRATKLPANRRLIPAAYRELAAGVEHDEQPMSASTDDPSYTRGVHRDAAMNSQNLRVRQKVDGLAER